MHRRRWEKEKPSWFDDAFKARIPPSFLENLEHAPVGGGADLAFGAPQAWRPEFTEQLEGAGRFQPVTLPSLLRDGATHFCWLNAGEELKAGDTSWMPSKEGAFLYRRKDAAPLFFPVRAVA